MNSSKKTTIYIALAMLASFLALQQTIAQTPCTGCEGGTFTARSYVFNLPPCGNVTVICSTKTCNDGTSVLWITQINLESISNCTVGEIYTKLIEKLLHDNPMLFPPIAPTNKNVWKIYQSSCWRHDQTEPLHLVPCSDVCCETTVYNYLPATPCTQRAYESINGKIADNCTPANECFFICDPLPKSGLGVPGQY